MDAFIMRRGGGGNPLNFTVVGGTAQPESPKENTIWVNTDQEITGWIVSSAEPTETFAGLVWIASGSSFSVGFNALKKDAIQLTIGYVKQYTNDGEWVDVPAAAYQGGEWFNLVGTY